VNKVSTDILIVGAGPAGLAAAAAASTNASVTIVDDNPLAGGQIWRAERGKVSIKTQRLLPATDHAKVRLLNGVQIHSAINERCLAASSANGNVELEFEKLVIATGARERFLPFPGWTLHGVFGAGGLQALVKGGLNIAGKRVIISGTGPLLLAVGEYLKHKGANVLAIVEQASRSNINRFGLHLLSSPSKLRQAITLRAKLSNVPYLTNCWVTHASGGDRLHNVTLTRNGKTRSLECDLLACGFHLVPNVELASLLSCTIENGFVTVNEYQQTSIANVFCAGEPTGIGGVESALVEGEIAGLAASGQSDLAMKLFAVRDRARRFGEKMDLSFALRDELRILADDNTIVCRCEDVTFGRLKDFTNFREAKLQTRCGMGPCQGRICGPASEFLFGWEPPSVRPPIFPVKMEHL